MTAESLSAPLLGARFTVALGWAAELHHRQRRNGTAIPYVAHLLGVTALVLEGGGDEDQAIAALLHDAVEDQGGPPTLERIRARFGERVAGIVAACTDSVEEPGPPWRPRKEAYLRHLPEHPPEALLVSVADKLHNARAILADYRVHGDQVFGRFSGGKEGTLWYYQALVAVYRDAGFDHPFVAELERTVAALVALCERAPPASDMSRGWE